MEWLRANEFDPATVKIIVVPVDVVGDNGLFQQGPNWVRGQGIPSPFSLLTDQYFDDLSKFLNYYEIKISDLMELDQLLFPEYYKKPSVIEILEKGNLPTLKLGSIKTDVRTGQSFKIGEPTLENNFLALVDVLNSRIMDQTKRSEAVQRLSFLFEGYFQDYGYSKNNPFHRQAKYTIRKIAIQFHKYGVIENPSLNSYNLWSEISHTSFYSSKNAKRDHPQQKQTVQNWFGYLKDDLVSKKTFDNRIIAEDVKEILRDVIDLHLSDYYDKVASYWDAEDLLAEYPDSSRKILLQDIIHSSKILESLEFKNQIAQLLFGREIFDFLRSDQNYKRVSPWSLNRMKLLTLQWTIDDFAAINIPITSYQLLLAKQNVIKEIDKWMFYDPYPNNPYFKPMFVKGKTLHYSYELLPEFNTINSFWYAASLHEDNQDITYTDISHSYDLPHLRNWVMKGQYIGIQTATTMLALLDQWSVDESSRSSPDPLKLRFYNLATYQITKNLGDRYLGFADRHGTAGGSSYSKLWYQRHVKATINILSVVMTGGIDPLFGFLDPKIFDGNPNTGLYQPHHMSDAETHLVTVGRIIMLDDNWHHVFGQLATTPQGVKLQELIMEGIYKLMDKSGDVTPADIVKVFGNLQIFGKKVSDWWFQQPDFNNKLKTWNAGRALIQNGDIEGFLHFMFDYQKGSKTVNPLVERFFMYAKKTIGSFLTLENFKDFSYLFTQKDREFIKKYFFI